MGIYGTVVDKPKHNMNYSFDARLNVPIEYLVHTQLLHALIVSTIHLSHT